MTSESGVETETDSEAEGNNLGVSLVTLEDNMLPSSGYGSLVSSDAEVEDEDIFKKPRDLDNRDRHSFSLLADYPGSLLDQTRSEVAKMSLTLTPHEMEAARDFESYRVVENVMKAPLVKRPASPDSPLHDRYNTLSSLQDDDEDELEISRIGSEVRKMYNPDDA